jgi:RNA polymerase sigma-70 factor (ECF subfamily)
MADVPVPVPLDEAAWFDEFVLSMGVRLRQALIARFGVDWGCDACAEALAWAWEHRTEVRAMENPAGYLFRVAQSSIRPQLRWSRHVVLVPRNQITTTDEVDLDLADALATLKHAQRVSVVLVHAYGWSYAEVAALLGITVAATTNHVHRGLRKLRNTLEES